MQVIPHITNEIKNPSSTSVGKTNPTLTLLSPKSAAPSGDIESQPFLEAIRQVSLEVGRENCLFIHVTLVPYLCGSDEHKTKPTQHSVKELQGMGIKPDIIVLPLRRASRRLHHAKNRHVLQRQAETASSKTSPSPVLYEAPVMLEKSGFSETSSATSLALNTAEPDLCEWTANARDALITAPRNRENRPRRQIRPAPRRLSLRCRSAQHTAALHTARRSTSSWIDSEDVTEDNDREHTLAAVDGIIVPGGFGRARHRRHDHRRQILPASTTSPIFGICLGMQIAGNRVRARHRGHGGRQLRRIRPETHRTRS